MYKNAACNNTTLWWRRKAKRRKKTRAESARVQTNGKVATRCVCFSTIVFFFKWMNKWMNVSSLCWAELNVVCELFENLFTHTHTLIFTAKCVCYFARWKTASLAFSRTLSLSHPFFRMAQIVLVMYVNTFGIHIERERETKSSMKPKQANKRKKKLENEKHE